MNDKQFCPATKKTEQCVCCTMEYCNDMVGVKMNEHKIPEISDGKRRHILKGLGL